MSEKNYIPLRKFLNESLVRDFLIFLLLFLLILTQEWSNILLVLFPLISFGFSLFFKTISGNKWRFQSEESPIIYNPIGSEKKHSSRLFFTSIVQLVLLFWIGAESFYRPQMINFYSFFFNPLFIFIYTFGYYWIFIDLWKFSKISVILDHNDMEEIGGDYKFVQRHYNQVFSKLKIKKFKKISMGSLIVFIFLNITNLAFILYQLKGINFGFYYTLPGTGIETSEPIMISYFIYVVLIVPPLSTITFLRISYKDINNLELKNIQELVSPLPDDIQQIILKNIKLLHRNFKKHMS